jgi:ribosomal-protein-alanine N-acetyltransferase
VITIRNFEPTDTFRVIKLASETLTERYNHSLFSYFYETNPEGFIVADLNHKIIGFLVGIKINPEKMKILMLSVSPLYQKHKIGTRLLQEYIKKIQKLNTRYIELEVRVDNKKAIKFYEKNDFKIVDEIKEFYQNGEDAYTMRLII